LEIVVVYSFANSARMCTDGVMIATNRASRNRRAGADRMAVRAELDH